MAAAAGTVVAATAAMAAMASLGCGAARAAGSSASRKPLPAFLSGGDISLLDREEEKGQVYKDGGKPRDLLEIFKSRGCNTMRVRLWVHPTGKDIYISDLPHTIALGRRIKRAGLFLILDIHYSDTWADPSKQFKPAAWESLPFPQLVQTVHDYTRDVIAAMGDGGAMPDMVQVGNEISAGMLWPDGKDWGPGHDFRNLGALLKAGIRGVKDGAGRQPPPWIMIHIDKGGDPDGARWFLDGIRAQGVSFDVIGLSFYPYFQGKLTQLKATLDDLAGRYHKPIVIAETGYAYREDDREMKPGTTYPKTPEGQRQFLQDLAATVHATPYGLGRGILYWAPEWIPVKGLRGSWNGYTLFDDAGNALPGIDALGQAVRTDAK